MLQAQQSRRILSMLMRIEVNICYEVGITHFARISRFLYTAETFCSANDTAGLKLVFVWLLGPILLE